MSPTGRASRAPHPPRCTAKISGNGTIAGITVMPGAVNQAFILRKVVFTPVPTITADGAITEVDGVNNAGAVTGLFQSVSHALGIFYWSPAGGLTTAYFQGKRTQPRVVGISNAGVLFGTVFPQVGAEAEPGEIFTATCSGC